MRTVLLCALLAGSALAPAAAAPLFEQSGTAVGGKFISVDGVVPCCKTYRLIFNSSRPVEFWEDARRSFLYTDYNEDGSIFSMNGDQWHDDQHFGITSSVVYDFQPFWQEVSIGYYPSGALRHEYERWREVFGFQAWRSSYDSEGNGVNLPYSYRLRIYDLESVVPEPATWAMMIAGFGLVGMQMRCRKLAIV